MSLGTEWVCVLTSEEKKMEWLQAAKKPAAYVAAIVFLAKF